MNTMTDIGEQLDVKLLLTTLMALKKGITVLDRLKRDPGTRHIPVHVMSSLRERERALRKARSGTSTSRWCTTCCRKTRQAGCHTPLQ